MCSDPDVTTIEMNDTEDFLIGMKNIMFFFSILFLIFCLFSPIVACDGLWDTVTPEEATECVFKTLRQNKGKFLKSFQTRISSSPWNTDLF